MTKLPALTFFTGFLFVSYKMVHVFDAKNIWFDMTNTIKIIIGLAHTS